MTIVSFDTAEKKNYTWHQDCKNAKLIIAQEVIGKYAPSFEADIED
jgi:hypothetical protein